MKSNPAPAPDAPLPAGFLGAWTSFWFAPAAPIGLHAMRILAGLLFIAWLLPLTGERQALFSLTGWFDREAIREANLLPGGSPIPLGWSVFYLVRDHAALFDAYWFGSLAVLALFTLGIATRITSVLTWVIVVSALWSPATHFDADFLMPVLAFYLMLAYVLLGQFSRQLSPLERILGPRGTSIFAFVRPAPAGETPSYAANVALRLFQVHFALIVLTSTLHMLQFSDWWTGVAYWYALHPPLDTTAEQIAREKGSAITTLTLLSVLEYLGLAWKFTFPLFAFRRRWRWLLLSGAVVFWVYMAFVDHKPLFGPFYFLACLSYLTPDEWQRVLAPLTGLFSRAPANASAPDARSRVPTTA